MRPQDIDRQIQEISHLDLNLVPNKEERKSVPINFLEPSFESSITDCLTSAKTSYDTGSLQLYRINLVRSMGPDNFKNV